MIRVLQRNRINKMYIYVKRCIIRNGLGWLYRLMSPKICRGSWQAGYPGESMVFFQSKGAGSKLRKEFLFKSKGRKRWWPSSKAWRQEESSPTWGRVSPFVLIRPSTDWMGPTSIMKSNLLYSVCWIKCYLIQKHPHRNTHGNVWPNIQAPHGLVKLMIKLAVSLNLIPVTISDCESMKHCQSTPSQSGYENINSNFIPFPRN